jgi:hypothetical protein
LIPPATIARRRVTQLKRLERKSGISKQKREVVLNGTIGARKRTKARRRKNTGLYSYTMK